MRDSKHLKIVIKIGTSSIVDEKTHEPIVPILSSIVDTAVKLKRDGHKVVIVSSGAIGMGLQKMKLEKKPKRLEKKQALAAIGQCKLMSTYDNLFSMMQETVAQILLTRNDIVDHSQYVNAQNTLNQVLAYGVIPIVNENDTVAVSEIKFGDNDTLSANTAGMIHADYLFLLTDVEALYDKNPRLHSDAQPVRVVENIETLKVNTSTRGSSLGTGGMLTKITAAKIATSMGITTIITKSSDPGRIKEIIASLHPPESNPSSNWTPPGSTILVQPPLHTMFLPSPKPIRDRAFWIQHGRVPQGTIYIDKGAGQAVRNRADLYPAGIVGVVGDFAQEEAVRIVVVDRPVRVGTSAIQSSPSSLSTSIGAATAAQTAAPTASTTSTPTTASIPTSTTKTTDEIDDNLTTTNTETNDIKYHSFEKQGEEIARAIVNYSSIELSRIKGQKSSKIQEILGYIGSDYAAFRWNISLLIPNVSRPQTPTRTSTFGSGTGSTLTSNLISPSTSSSNLYSGLNLTSTSTSTSTSTPTLISTPNSTSTLISSTIPSMNLTVTSDANTNTTAKVTANTNTDTDTTIQDQRRDNIVINIDDDHGDSHDDEADIESDNVTVSGYTTPGDEKSNI